MTKPRRHFKAPKLILYQHAPRIIRELRIPGMDTRKGEPTKEEWDGACDILYRLFCDESIRAIARRLRRKPQDVFDALSIALMATPAELEAMAKSKRQSPEG